MLDIVPEAVVVKILLLLSLRTLVQLCSVSKAWKSFITSHSFIFSHLQRSLSNPNPHSPFLIRYPKHTFQPLWHYAFWSSNDPFPYNFLKLEPPYQISNRFAFSLVQSLHGIFCLIEKKLGFQYMDRGIVLWNPSIRRYMRLEVPAVDLNAIGFGFDSKSNDFKVIIRSWTPNQMKLYSLNEGTWKVLDVSYVQVLGFVIFSHTSCFLNGSVHWITEIANNKKILIFNVEEEKFKNLELPLELDNALLSYLHITVIEDCISVIRYHNIHEFDDECDIWMMKEYGVTESWTKIVTFKFPKEVSELFGPSKGAEILLLLQNNAAERIDGDFVSFDYYDDKIKMMMDVQIRGYKIFVGDYRESLVLLDKKMGVSYIGENKILFI